MKVERQPCGAIHNPGVHCYVCAAKRKQGAIVKPEYESNRENYHELFLVALRMTKRDIKIALSQRKAMHSWAIKAYEDALDSKGSVR